MLQKQLTEKCQQYEKAAFKNPHMYEKLILLYELSGLLNMREIMQGNMNLAKYMWKVCSHF